MKISGLNIPEDVLLWHGDSNVASWAIIGESAPSFGPPEAMFDRMYGNKYMYHSKHCEDQNYGGIIITFNEPVRYADLIIHTRSTCCRDDQYNNVCLYADGANIGCTPNNLGDPGITLSFKDYTTTNTIGQEFRLNWENENILLDSV